MRWCRFDSLAFAWASELEFRVQSSEFRVQSLFYSFEYNSEFIRAKISLTETLLSSRALCVLYFSPVCST